MMKNILIIIASLLITSESIACLFASQNRLFPLGKSDEGLCVVETHLTRSLFDEKENVTIEIKPAWSGLSYFNIYDKDYNLVFSEILDTIQIFEEKHFDSIIWRTFDKGMIMARNLENFVEAQPISISFCNYQQDCETTKLYSDTINNEIGIQISEQIKHPIPFLNDSLSILTNLINHFKGNYDSSLSVKILRNNLRINSIRYFEIGDETLIIHHFGVGSQLYSDIAHDEENSISNTFKNINSSVFIEPVLHHGHGFDFYLWK